MNRQSDLEQYVKIAEFIYNQLDSDKQRLLLKYIETEEKVIALLMDIYLNSSADGQWNLSSVNKTAIRQRLEEELTQIVGNLAENESAIVYSALAGAYIGTYYRHAHLMSNLTKTNVRFNLQSNVDSIVKSDWNGIVYEDRIVTNHQTLVNNIITSTIQTINRRQPIEVLVSKVQGQMGTRYNHSETLINSEGNHLIGLAQETIAKDSQIVRVLEFCAVLDNRTTKYCREHDGRLYSLNDSSRPILPAHINCRSIWSLYIEYEATIPNPNYEERSFEDWETEYLIA